MHIEKYNVTGEYLDTVKENVFGDCEDVLDYLEEARVCTIGYNEKRKRFWIGEQCDEYFLADLTEKQCRDLSELFLKIAERIETIR